MLAVEVLPAEESLQLLLKARDELEQAAKNSPENLQLQAALASCCDMLGEIYGRMQQVTPSRVNAVEAVRIWKQLADDDLSLANYRALAASQLKMSSFVEKDSELQSVDELADQSRERPRKTLDALFPSDAKQLYEAACELTSSRPWLTQGPSSSLPAPPAEQIGRTAPGRRPNRGIMATARRHCARPGLDRR